MSTTVIRTLDPAPALLSSSTAWPRAVLVLVALIFLSTEHDWTVSRAEAYTSTADEMEAAAGGGNAIRRLAFLTLAGIGIVSLATSEKRWRTVSGAALCFAFFAGWAYLSVLWSIDFGMTIRRLFVLSCFLLGAIGLARSLTGRDLMRIAIVLSMVSLAVGVLAELSLGTFRPWGNDYRFAGTQHPNTTALSLSTAAIAAFCLWRSENRKAQAVVLFAAAFGALMLTKSRTSAAGVLAALMFLWTLSTPLRVKAGVVAFLAWFGGVVAILVLLSGWSIEEEISRVALMGREEQSESLTGRIPIWTELAPWVGRRFLTGYGYDSFWTPDHIDRVTRELQWGIREAHSAYVDLTLSVGLPAALALLTGILLVMRRAAGMYLAWKRPEHGFFLGLLLFCLINALTESAMVMPLFIPFLAACGIAQLALFESPDAGRSVHSSLTSDVFTSSGAGAVP